MDHKDILINVLTRATCELTSLYQDALYQLNRGQSSAEILADISAHLGKVMGFFVQGLNKVEEADEGK